MGDFEMLKRLFKYSLTPFRFMWRVRASLLVLVIFAILFIGMFGILFGAGKIFYSMIRNEDPYISGLGFVVSGAIVSFGAYVTMRGMK